MWVMCNFVGFLSCLRLTSCLSPNTSCYTINLANNTDRVLPEITCKSVSGNQNKETLRLFKVSTCLLPQNDPRASHLKLASRLNNLLLPSLIERMNKIHIVACQAHPALVKQVQSQSVSFNFMWSVINRLRRPWSVSRCCPEPRWFNGDPTLLARNNIYFLRIVHVDVRALKR